VTGYHIYYGNDGANYQYVADAGTNTSYVVAGLQEGETNSFVVTAYNAQGVESDPSNLITYLVPGLVELAPKTGPRSPAVIRFAVAPGHTYQVQASVNLTTWNTIGRITATNNAWTQFQDLEGANLKLRFYRLVWQ
jgi:fibronectin type 3 domain-containing protein